MTKRKIVLVRPFIREYVNSQSSESFESNIGLVPPLNIVCLSGAVREAGHEVLIYDCERSDSTEAGYQKFLKEHNPDVIGISIMTPNFHGAHHSAKLARKAVPNAKIICGGTHLTIFPKETLEYSEFDYAFSGEGEGPLVQFLDNLDSLNEAEIPGFVWRKGDEIIANSDEAMNENLDVLPLPAYDLLDLDFYQMPNSDKRLISLYLSRGCPYKCGFCYRNPQLLQVRFKSVDRALEEIGLLVEKYGIKSINFVDETISIKKKWFLEFCEKLAAKNWDLKWQSPTRVTSIDEEIVKAAKKAGCHTFRFGLESGSPRILEKIDKHINLEATRRAVKLCRQYGIKTVGYFIVGYLDETPETIQETIRFAKALKLSYAAFFPATPMPNTALLYESEARGLVPKDYWRNFVLGKTLEPLPFVYPNAGDWAAKAYRSFYFSPKYVLRQMKEWDFYKKLPNNIRVAWDFLTMKYHRQQISITSLRHV
ncbi:MAG: B12-binding domain-containing radical SAM protein [Deltaproteobacteria bacterium]|nr:B12-binding domain-containing radical SAM protein [Deltaproteobacteria bacterium]